MGEWCELRAYHGTLFLTEKDHTADVYNNLEEFWKNHSECETLIPTVTQYMVPFFQVLSTFITNQLDNNNPKLRSEIRR